MTAIELALSAIANGSLVIDSEGRVWRAKRGDRILPAPVRAETVGHKGYLRIVLGVPRTKKTCSLQAHRLVWIAANGLIPDGLQINHKNLDKQDNRLDNLELVTGEENIQHSYANGRIHPWTSATTWRGKPRLTEEDKQRIRDLRAQGRTIPEISQSTGVSKTHVHRIITGAA